MHRPKDHRSVDGAVQRAAFVAQLAHGPRRAVDHQVLHRIDVWHPDALETVFGPLRELEVRYASLNDHTPGQGQYRDLQKFFQMREEYGNAPEQDKIHRRMQERAADTRTVPTVYHQVANATRSLGMVLATHDDDSLEKVDVQCQIGATVNEFPVTIEVAEHARTRGMAIVVGAPNIVRGGSQSANLAASELLQRGLADVICADYHAPSVLAAAFKVVQCGWATLPAAIRMITLNAARAVRRTIEVRLPPVCVRTSLWSFSTRLGFPTSSLPSSKAAASLPTSTPACVARPRLPVLESGAPSAACGP